MKLKMIMATAGTAVALAGCNYSNSSPPPAKVTGTVEDIVYAQNWNTLSKTWSAVLLLPQGQTYDGAPDVNLGNDGNESACFGNFIHNGDTLTVVAGSNSGYSFNSLDFTDVTVNGTPLSSYSC